MLWSRLVILFVAAGMLMGCGFLPLYSSDSLTETRGELASIQVLPIENRVGQLLHNNLLDLLNSRGKPRDPKYKLDIKLSQYTTHLGVQKNSLATRANFTLTASFTLLHSDGASILGGTNVVISSFNILESAPFATSSSEKGARARAIRLMAHDIQRRLEIFFAKR